MQSAPRRAAHVAEAIANHVIGAAKLGVAGNCNKTVYLPERKAALDQWGARLMDLVERHLMTLQGTAEKTLMTSAPNGSA